MGQVKLYPGDPVVMVDRYAARAACTCKAKHEASSFNGMRGRVTQVMPFVMVHLDGERLPMRFDERDFERVESVRHVGGAE
jgi:hypothetical protein